VQKWANIEASAGRFLNNNLQSFRRLKIWQGQAKKYLSSEQCDKKKSPNVYKVAQK